MIEHDVVVTSAASHALQAWLPEARALRRTLHAEPRLSGCEAATVDLLIGSLPSDGVVTRIADTGAIIRFGGDGLAVAVRAELDALPLIEQSGVDWAATNGAMHACGHDIHMAAAVAVAHCWKELPVPLVLILQPREETYPSGAYDIVRSGVLQDNEVAAVIGAHVQPLLDRGVVAAAPGPVNASADVFHIAMTGVGGHAAYPHLGTDPVLAIAQFVTGIQQLVSRNSDPTVATVASVGVLSAGELPNVRPGTARASGTIRSLSHSHRELLLARLRDVAHGVAQTVGCQAEVSIEHGEPALVNDPAIAARAREQLAGVGLTPKADLISCGADDFAYFSEQVPSLMMFVGTGARAGQLHHPSFLPGDDVVDDVASALLTGVIAAADVGVADR